MYSLTLSLKDLFKNTHVVRSAQNIYKILHSRNLRDVYPNVDIVAINKSFFFFNEIECKKGRTLE